MNTLVIFAALCFLVGLFQAEKRDVRMLVLLLAAVGLVLFVARAAGVHLPVFLTEP